MQEEKSPYLVHIFVCTNDRQGKRASCADRQSPALKAALKQFIKTQGWQGRVRVSTSGCMGCCNTGANVMLYPQGIWYQQVTMADIPMLEQRIRQLLEDC